MLTNKNRLIKGSGWAVRLAVWANRLFLAMVLLGLLLSWLFPTRFAALLFAESPGVDVHQEIVGLRLLLLLGVAMAIATESFLTALAQIVASAVVGDPFIAINAHRLRSMGWALFALQLLDIPGAMIQRFFPAVGSAAPDGSFSPGGWIAVLMLFVLSHVFAAGSAMRDDLEGTV